MEFSPGTAFADDQVKESIVRTLEYALPKAPQPNISI
jgi:hypothetical protein